MLEWFHVYQLFVADARIADERGNGMHTGLKIVVIGLTLFMLTYAAANAADPGNAKCMNCHGQKDLIADGGMSVYIDPAKFAATSHAIVGCITCHDSVSAAHPRDGYAPAKATCRDCHSPIYDEYAKSMHASKARCNDCHNPHDARMPEVMSGDDINRKCARCHDTRKTIQTHSRWLPQADLHIESLLCITCHTGSRDYVITLSIESRLPDSGSDFKTSEYKELSTLLRGENISDLVDLNKDSHISLQELKEFNRHLRGKNMRLSGMMIPETVTHSYQILDNRWDCSFCHASGPKAMQRSFMVFPDKSGGYRRVAVEQGAILDTLYGTPDFYMLGTTRSRGLNILGGLIIAAGLSFPVGHGFFRLLTRNKRKGNDDEA